MLYEDVKAPKPSVKASTAFQQNSTVRTISQKLYSNIEKNITILKHKTCLVFIYSHKHSATIKEIVMLFFLTA